MGFKALKDVLLKTIISGAEKVFVNDNGVIKQTSINNFIVTDPEHTSNKVTTMDSTNTDTQYPSAKCVYTELQNKQNKLTPGDNITIDENNVISATSGGGSDAYIITVTNNMSDKTPAEIKAAWENGQPVYAVTDVYDYILHLTDVSDSRAIFNSEIPDDGYMDIMTLAVNYNRSVVVTIMPQQPKLKAGDNITIDKNNTISANVSSMDDTKINMTGQFAGSSLNQMIAGLNESVEDANAGVSSIGEGLAELFRMKQDKLTAGSNIIIDENNVIAVTDPILENAKETGGIGYTEGEATTITWDGDTSGLSVINGLAPFPYYKVGEAVELTALQGATVNASGDFAEFFPHTILDSEINEIVEGLYTVRVETEPNQYLAMLIVCIETGEYYGLQIESGVYFPKDGEDFMVSSLTYGSETIHKIDTKYIDAVPTEVTNAIETGGIGYTEGEATTITWDGDTSGLVSAANYFYKVANYTTVTKENLIGCIVSLQNDNRHPTPFTIEEDDIHDSEIPHAILVSDYVLFVSEPTSYGPFNFEESGIYFANVEGIYVESLTYGRTVSKIDSKYLPFEVFNFTIVYYPDMNTTGLDVNYEDLEKACRNPNIIVNGHLSEPEYGALYNLTKIGSGTHFICFIDWVSGDKVKLYYYKVDILSDGEIAIEKGYLDGAIESE